MLPYNDPETLMLFVEQRREELRRTMETSRSLPHRLDDVRGRLLGFLRATRRAPRMRASRRSA
jgi:hypothetical protein